MDKVLSFAQEHRAVEVVCAFWLKMCGKQYKQGNLTLNPQTGGYTAYDEDPTLSQL